MPDLGPVKAPAFPLYARDILVDCATLSAEAFGAYTRLLCYAWIGIQQLPQGFLNRDSASLAKLAGVSLRRWSAIAEDVVPLFCEDTLEDGTKVLYSKRLLRCLEEARERSEKARQSVMHRYERTTNVERSKAPSTYETPTKRLRSGYSASASASASAEEEKKEPPVSPPCRPDVTPSRKPASPATHAPYSSPFMAFWEAYPRKVAKGEAWKAWLVLRPAPELQAEMLRAIAAQMRSPRWQGGTIPNPATWLRARRWEDDPASLTAIGERRNGGHPRGDDRPNPYKPTRAQLDALPVDHPDRRYWDDEIH